MNESHFNSDRVSRGFIFKYSRCSTKNNNANDEFNNQVLAQKMMNKGCGDSPRMAEKGMIEEGQRQSGH